MEIMQHVFEMQQISMLPKYIEWILVVLYVHLRKQMQIV
jgi:hypothetical protein